MSIADAQERRRAALRIALRKGDVLAAARAWQRLRGSGAAVSPAEAGAARAARVAVGHALRDARYRRDHDTDRFGFHVEPEAAAPLARRPAPRTRLPFAIAATLALVLLALFLYQPGNPGGSDLSVARPSPAPVEIAGGGRGRTSATSVPVSVAATAQPAPATPAPNVSPGTGSGGGSGEEDPFALLPRQKAQDYRIVFLVRDTDTVRPLRGVCVVFGTECAGGKRTNVDGIAYFDFPLENIAPMWNFEFFFDGYTSRRVNVLYSGGASPQSRIDVFLKRT